MNSARGLRFTNLNVLDFNFKAIQLNRLSWRDFLTQLNPVAAALMSKMNIPTEERPQVKAECLQLLATLKGSNAILLDRTLILS